MAKARPAAPPFRAVQLATLADAVPTGSGWIHEYKYDGYRLLLSVGPDGARAFTRNGHDWSHRFAGLVEAAARAFPPGTLVDGEAVALDKDGKPDFGLMQRRLKDDGSAALDFFAFDLLVDAGEELAALPTRVRKERLRKRMARIAAPLHYADHVDGGGEAMLAAICGAGGEGIIAKRADAPYAGRRARHWLKVKCTRRDEFVIIGWSRSTRGRGLRSLLLATREAGAMRYAGKVGTGLSGATIETLRDAMAGIEVARPPVAVPRAERAGVTWVAPTLVAEVAFTETTAAGTLRHPSFLGLRADKPAAAVRRERAAPADLRHGVRISSEDRAIFPESGLTKGDLADYYGRIAPLLLTVGARRPLTLVRCPQGRARQCFFQKHDSGAFGAAVHPVAIRDKDGTSEDYLWVDSAAGLLGCVQMGTIEFHGWGSRIDALERPDRLVFDLDPDDGLGWDNVRAAALRLRAVLGAMGLASHAMLSGGKGVHLVVPLDGKAAWPQVKDFADRFARAMASAEPGLFTANIRKTARKGRIFLDWLRNQRGATAVLPYSARARPGAPVAAPVAWDELAGISTASAFSIADVEQLVDRAGSAALDGWGVGAQPLPDA